MLVVRRTPGGKSKHVHTTHSASPRVVIALVAPVLVLAAACASGGATSGSEAKAAPQDGQRQTHPDKASPGVRSQPSAHSGKTWRSLKNQGQLGKAAIASKDLGGRYQVTEAGASETLVGSDVKVNGRRCQPIADTLSAKPERRRLATVYRTVLNGDPSSPATNSPTGGLDFTNVVLGTYRSGQAQKTFKELDEALDACRSFTIRGKKGQRIEVARAEAGKAGDQSVAFLLKEAPATDVNLAVVVFRAGSTLAYFTGISPTPSSGVDAVPAAVISKQEEKLQAASSKG